LFITDRSFLLQAWVVLAVSTAVASRKYYVSCVRSWASVGGGWGGRVPLRFSL